jgi:hypothetical protein
MFSVKSYYKPTPKKWRKIGDALLGVSLIAIPAELSGYPWISISVFFIGVIGKFLTNFFSDDENKI